MGWLDNWGIKECGNNVRLVNIKNFYFIGHWTGYMGGITNAVGKKIIIVTGEGI